EKVRRSDHVDGVVAEGEAQRVTGHATDAVAVRVQQMLDLEIESDPKSAAEGFEEIGGAGADVEHRPPAAQPSQQAPVDADAAAGRAMTARRPRPGRRVRREARAR